MHFHRFSKPGLVAKVRDFGFGLRWWTHPHFDTHRLFERFVLAGLTNKTKFPFTELHLFTLKAKYYLFYRKMHAGLFLCLFIQFFTRCYIFLGACLLSFKCGIVEDKLRLLSPLHKHCLLKSRFPIFTFKKFKHHQYLKCKHIFSLIDI